MTASFQNVWLMSYPPRNSGLYWYTAHMPPKTRR